MEAKPVIGINADFRAAQGNSPAFTFLSSGHYDAVIHAGGVPMVLPPLTDEASVDQVLDMLDGVLLVGGGDLDSRRDGYMLHPSMRLLDTRRENFDRMLVDKLAQRRLPVLAIGAGMQLLNVSLGGTLFLHIPEDDPMAIPHLDPMDPNHRHALEVDFDSLMGNIFGDGEIRVNSMHHMAVDDVAPGFAVTGRCPDGIAEVIESQREEWFAVGTQFHPEAQSASALDLRIFEEFVGGVTRRQRGEVPMQVFKKKRTRRRRALAVS